jgi:hypothetical protein
LLVLQAGVVATHDDAPLLAHDHHFLSWLEIEAEPAVWLDRSEVAARHEHTRRLVELCQAVGSTRLVLPTAPSSTTRS